MSTDLSPADRLPHELEPVGAVQALPIARSGVCEWAPVEDGFDSACGQAWHWHDNDDAGKHPWNYCACCGRPVLIVESEND